MWGTDKDGVECYIMYLHFVNQTPEVGAYIRRYDGQEETVELKLWPNNDIEPGNDKLYRYRSDDGITWSLDGEGYIYDDADPPAPILGTEFGYVPFNTECGPIFNAP
jgi:hypothetical protein